MTFSYSLKFAKSLIFPKSEKKSIARKSLFGAVLCIGLSIVPLIVVTSVTNGMIDGMTERIIGLSSSHIQAYVSPNISKVKTVEEFIEYANDTAAVKGITGIYPEVDISAIAAGKKGRSGIEIRAVEKDIFVRNQSFAKLFEVSEGEIDSFVNSGEESRAGAVIGKQGAGINELKKELEKVTNAPLRINVEEVKKPELSAKLVAENIGFQLGKRMNFRRAVKMACASTMNAGAKGIRVEVAGRLNGAEMSRREKFIEGSVPLHTLRADIDFYVEHAQTIAGIVGVKVWIYKGEK